MVIGGLCVDLSTTAFVSWSGKLEVLDSMLIGTHPVSGMANHTGQVCQKKRMAECELLIREALWCYPSTQDKCSKTSLNVFQCVRDQLKQSSSSN
ncbi:hypothetical protein ACTXT7_016260 [Hymenolepis weldensis]